MVGCQATNGGPIRMSDSAVERRHLQLVTGKLAAPALRRVITPLAEQLGMDFTISVLPITVAALMTPAWIAKRLEIAPDATEIVIPGHCGTADDAERGPLQAITALPIIVGPKDLHGLPEFLGRPRTVHESWGEHSVEIIAEINHAPRRTMSDIVDMAREYQTAGADIIDIGCQPGEPWSRVADCVRRLKDEGLRVSIDSFDADEVKAAADAGAELVLSVNSSNRDAAPDWGCEVVVIPDDPHSLSGLDETAGWLDQRQVPFRLDPILEPIGFGFAESIVRYQAVRQRYPTTPMMMGIGNVTELTDVDSAGVNLLLLAICEEWQIGSVLTTQVINWARSSVRECDLARKLVHFAIKHHVLPKHLEERLVMLRDVRLHPQGNEALDELSRAIRDPNYRIFAEDGELHLVSAGLHLQDPDPFQLFAALMATNPKNIDPSHAFYLGYELCKAVTALTLDKHYRQDQSLDWGFLTRPEGHHNG